MNQETSLVEEIGKTPKTVPWTDIHAEMKNQKPSTKGIGAALMKEMKQVTNHIVTILLKGNGGIVQTGPGKKANSKVSPSVTDPLRGTQGKGAVQTRGVDTILSHQEITTRVQGPGIREALLKRGTGSRDMIQRVLEITILAHGAGVKSIEEKRRSLAIVQTAHLNATQNETGLRRVGHVKGHKIGICHENETLIIRGTTPNREIGLHQMIGPNITDRIHMTTNTLIESVTLKGTRKVPRGKSKEMKCLLKELGAKTVLQEG